jgi:hypothetical protein
MALSLPPPARLSPNAFRIFVFYCLCSVAQTALGQNPALTGMRPWLVVAREHDTWKTGVKEVGDFENEQAAKLFADRLSDQRNDRIIQNRQLPVEYWDYQVIKRGCCLYRFEFRLKDMNQKHISGLPGVQIAKGTEFGLAKFEGGHSAYGYMGRPAEIRIKSEPSNASDKSYEVWLNWYSVIGQYGKDIWEITVLPNGGPVNMANMRVTARSRSRPPEGLELVAEDKKSGLVLYIDVSVEKVY